MSRKRQREAPNIDVQLVETYEDLANENEEIRLKAAHALVSKLSPENTPTTEQVERALNRLIRGLSSGRKAARIGFSIALTEILSQLFGPDLEKAPNSDITIERVLDILNNQTHPGGSITGQVRLCGSSRPVQLLMQLAAGRTRSSLWPSIWRRSYHQILDPLRPELTNRVLGTSSGQCICSSEKETMASGTMWLGPFRSHPAARIPNRCPKPCSAGDRPITFQGPRQDS